MSRGRFANIWVAVAGVAIVVAGVVWAAIAQLNVPAGLKAISAALAAAAGGGGTLLVNHFQNRKVRQARLRDNLRFWQPPGRLYLIREIDPFKLRITRSELAQEAAAQSEPPYVPRDRAIWTRRSAQRRSS